jgi:hypothetical protein
MGRNHRRRALARDRGQSFGIELESKLQEELEMNQIRSAVKNYRQ